MSSIKLTLVSFLTITANAAVQRRATTTITNGENTCGSQLDFINGGTSYCCPGNVYGRSGSNIDNAYCCVGAPFNVPAPSFASCFPFCSGTTSDVSVTSDTTMYSCATTIMLTDSDYSSKANAAASLTSTFSAMPTSGSASTTGASSSSSASSGSSSASSGSGSGSGSGSSASSTSASAASQTSGTSTSSGGAAQMTSGPMAGALMVAGGLLVAVL